MPQELMAAIANAATHSVATGTSLRGTIPAPTGGWNTRDPEASMKPHYAILMDNFSPEDAHVVTRKGRVEYASLSDELEVNTLFSWKSGSSQKLFAISGTSLHDITDPDSVTTELSSGITNSRWRSVVANGNGILVNGEDEPLRIDASGSWVAHGYSGTGLTVSDLFQVTVHKNRLFFLEKDSQRVWYGDLNAVTGSLNKFNLGLIVHGGGNCKAIGSVSLDTGIGMDDLLAIFMENGDVAVYSGDDPSSIGGWLLAGIYRLAPVVGDKPLVSLGGDLVAITRDGYLPVLQFMSRGRHRKDYAFSDAISPSVNEAVLKNEGLEGWEAVLFTNKNHLFFNVPTGSSSTRKFVQHVMNVRNGAWTRYRGWDDCYCWQEHEGRLFHGGKGKVWEAEVGESDGGAPIYCQARSAYNYLRSPYDKQFKSLRHQLETASLDSPIGTGATADFDRFVHPTSEARVVSEGAEWDTADWDIARWASGVYRSREWRRTGLRGSCISVFITATVKDSFVKWYSSDILYSRLSGRI